MNTQPVIGISGCLTGSAVRFDGGHKRMGFVMDELAQWVAFKPVCPEMAIGLPVPRPALPADPGRGDPHALQPRPARGCDGEDG
jgi:uncharacterized protein YbbK (DUF523 family)